MRLLFLFSCFGHVWNFWEKDSSPFNFVVIYRLATIRFSSTVHLGRQQEPGTGGRTVHYNSSRLLLAGFAGFRSSFSRLAVCWQNALHCILALQLHIHQHSLITYQPAPSHCIRPRENMSVFEREPVEAPRDAHDLYPAHTSYAALLGDLRVAALAALHRFESITLDMADARAGLGWAMARPEPPMAA